MMAALSEERPGRFMISGDAAPTDEERDWMRRRLQAVGAAIRVDPAARDAKENRLHGFLMGFKSLRSLDEATFKFTLDNFVEAAGKAPWEAVDRACRAWNQGDLPWANASFPPEPPEIARAAAEMLTAMKHEERELRILLEAGVVKLAPPPPTQAERDTALARWEAIKAEIFRSASMHDGKILPTSTDALSRHQAREDLADRERHIAVERDEREGIA